MNVIELATVKVNACFFHATKVLIKNRKMFKNIKLVLNFHIKYCLLWLYGFETIACKFIVDTIITIEFLYK